MSIISTITRRVANVIGDRRIHYGKFKNAQTGGEINTGLEICEFLFLQGTASTAGSATYHANVAEFPVAGTAVAVVSNSIDGGHWFAYGR